MKHFSFPACQQRPCELLVSAAFPAHVPSTATAPQCPPDWCWRWQLSSGCLCQDGPDAGGAGTGLRSQPPDGAGPRRCSESRMQPHSCQGLPSAHASSSALSSLLFPRHAQRLQPQPKTTSSAPCAKCPAKACKADDFGAGIA